MRQLVFIDDDQTELDAFRGIVGAHYHYTTIHWPRESAKLFSIAAPDIFVSDLYLPSSAGDSASTQPQREEAAKAAGRVSERFFGLYSDSTLDDKTRLKDTMKAISDAYAMLKLQWSALGQSPNYGIALLNEVKARYPEVPFIFYSRKITPEDVIRVLQAGAVDAIRKGALNTEQMLVRLASAQKIYRTRKVHGLPNVNVTLYPTE